MQTTKVLDHFPGGHAVVNGGVVTDESDPPADFGWVTGDVISRDRRDSLRGTQDGAEDSQDGCFSRTIGSQQPEDFAIANRKRNTVDCDESSSTEIIVGLRQMLNVNHVVAPGVLERGAEPTSEPA